MIKYTDKGWETVGKYKVSIFGRSLLIRVELDASYSGVNLLVFSEKQSFSVKFTEYISSELAKWNCNYLFFFKTVNISSSQKHFLLCAMQYAKKKNAVILKYSPKVTKPAVF